MEINTLQEFYTIMFETRLMRKKAVSAVLNNTPVPSEIHQILEKALRMLEVIPKTGKKYQLQLDDQNTIEVDLTYEIEEIKKDLYFLKHSEKEFLNYLAHVHRGFPKQIAAAIERLHDVCFTNFITDRDGTVNNYCGRYISSIQSIYNAVFLTRFAKKNVRNAIILTSAPLDNVGLVDISVAPDGAFINAGSKGREYFDKNGQRRQFPIKTEKQKMLDTLNQRLTALTQEEDKQKFTLIGSGLQFKFGQTTIARQDISGAVPEAESTAFLQSVEKLIQEIDPDGKTFRIEDTGKDIEIILTIDDNAEGGPAKDFDKGHGVRFLNEELNLGLEHGTNLVCGDTGSDVPMLEATLALNPHTWGIFVTKEEKLKERVRQATDQSLFVPEPDMLVSILNQLAR